jgi:hypothetical protein
MGLLMVYNRLLMVYNRLLMGYKDKFLMYHQNSRHKYHYLDVDAGMRDLLM